MFWGVVDHRHLRACACGSRSSSPAFLPGWVINVATIIHSDEALLATGFIFTIHFFNTHFRPEKFPMDTVIFTGRMRVEELKHDAPRALRASWSQSGELEKHLVEPPSPAFVALVAGSSASPRWRSASRWSA